MWLSAFAALGFLGIAGWWARRWWWAPAGHAVAACGTAPEVARDSSDTMPDAQALREINARIGERLWQLAYGAPPVAPALEKPHAEMRVAIVARLEPEKLNPDYLPRRPTLMQQLMRVVNDPDAQADKLSRMIAHDPVLGADVLRIANSSLYRVTPEPVESIQRAIVVCGLDGMRGILATAMVRPVFRASGKNFPRLPRLLWQRTERATRAAELYALKICPQDRFEAQLAVLLSALGPLVAHSAALDAYAQRPRLKPDASLLVELTRSVAPSMSVCIAQAWGLSQRILSALSRAASGPLASAVTVGELLGTLSTLEAHGALSESDEPAWAELGLDEASIRDIRAQISRP